ncbi:MAG TPA: ABC transporter ATP-binding protein [Candidatus Enterenecus avicola]|nr:ABC transporter ATP-binding protein [Candidatus Enterenecus avicola]
MKEKKKKPTYNMWQNTAYFVRAAWGNCPSVLLICLLLAVATAGATVVEMLFVPVVLGQVEGHVPLPQLLATIGVFTLALLLLWGGKTYLRENSLFGRIELREMIILRIVNKHTSTSYPNLMDTEFLRAGEQAQRTCSSNSAPCEGIWTTCTDILTNVLGFVAYLLLLTGLSGWMVALVVLTTAVGYLVNQRLHGWGYRHREEEAAYTNQMNYVRRVTTKREQAQDLRIFGLRPWLEEVWDSAMAAYQAFLMRQERVYFLTHVVDALLTLLRNGGAYAYLIWLTLTQGLSASQFLLYFAAISGFTQWVKGIMEQFSTLQRQSLEISKMREFLEWPESFAFEEGAPLPQGLKNCEIKLDHVSYRYPGAEKDTISNLTFTLHPGEKVAIVGLNGAGKTTLVKLLCGFLDPTRGSVRLNGVDIRTYNRREYYHLFSAVFQEFSVLDTNVAVNVAQRVDGIDRARVAECLEKAGLTQAVEALPKGMDTPVTRNVFEDGVELSGGQMQRLMLARALYRDAPVVVLDEPTAALDPLAEHDIYMKYNSMTQGKSSLFISHRLASTRFCDRILYMEQGRIAEEGTHQSLLDLGGGYAKLFEVQSRYYQEGGDEAWKRS